MDESESLADQLTSTFEKPGVRANELPRMIGATPVRSPRILLELLSELSELYSFSRTSVSLLEKKPASASALR